MTKRDLALILGDTEAEIARDMVRGSDKPLAPAENLEVTSYDAEGCCRSIELSKIP